MFKKSWLSVAHSFLALATVALLVSSCGGNNDPDPSTAPERPPVSSMEMDFSTFPSDNDGGRLATGQRQQTKLRFAASAITVGIWQTVLGLHLAIPVASFKASLSNTSPSWDADQEKWLWSNSFDVAGVGYTANLYGWLEGNNSRWEMYVSKENSFQDFLWYSGTSATDGSGGSWTLSTDPEGSPREYLDIVWNRDETAGTSDIKYTVTDASADSNGDYITYGITTDASYDAFYDIYDASEANLVEIEWNTTSKAGRVKSQLTGNDWACWDENLEDVECPQ